MRRLIWIALVLCAAGCSSGKELAMVKDSDPTWALVPDHLTVADMPR